MWILLCLALAVVESGDWSAILRAQQLFHEVYGKRIEAAKTSAEKSALAREILDLAKKESDSAAKMVELEEAKRLAVEANDAQVAVDIVRELATLPRDDIPTDLLAEAERLWQEGATPKATLSLNTMQALEYYFRSQRAGLNQKIWEERTDSLLTRHGFVLYAKDAMLPGIGSTLEAAGNTLPALAIPRAAGRVCRIQTGTVAIS